MLAPLLFFFTLVNAADVPVEKISVPGLKRPVEILRDKWGVSHIYAGNEHDLFFAQGYSTRGPATASSN